MFVKTFATRGGLNVILKLVRLVLKKKGSLADVIKSFYNPSSFRFASMLSSFTFLWKLVSNTLHLYTGSVSERNGAIAGFLAGFSILFETKENRVGYAQQIFMRSMHAGKNALKARGFRTLPMGDSLLFALGGACVIYGYALHPDTLPNSYYESIVKLAHIPKESLDLFRNYVKSSKDAHVDSKRYLAAFDQMKTTQRNRSIWNEYIQRHQGKMPGFPCIMYHPHSNGCTKYFIQLWLNVFQQLAPFNFFIQAFPKLITKPKSFMHRYMIVSEP